VHQSLGDGASYLSVGRICGKIPSPASRRSRLARRLDPHSCASVSICGSSPLVPAIKIQQLLGPATEGWNADSYRQLLYMQGVTHQKGATRTETFQQHAQDVLEHGGKLTLPELLHCRVRYFSDGLVLGSRIFVQDVFAAHRDEFGPKRRNGPRPIRHAALPTLFTLRDLRKAPILPPAYPP
jgi:hypothetical protein